MDYTKIALCICTRNRPDDLKKALASAWRSTLLPAQVIVSDDSDDAQAEQTRAACAEQPHPVDYIRGPRQGLSSNRNNCIDHLRDEIEAVSYIDDDVEITEGFLAGAAAAMAAEQGKALISGAENKNGALITPHNRTFWGHQELPPTGPDDYHAIVINTALFPRELFRKARFDEVLRYGSEEVDMTVQAEALGYRVRFVPELLNYHYPSPINRNEYKAHLDVSRLYSMYKYHRWIARDEKQAARFALLAPLHYIASMVKAGRIALLPEAIRTIRKAQGHIRDYARAHGEKA